MAPDLSSIHRKIAGSEVLTVTLDTGVLLRYIDGVDANGEFPRILELHRGGKIHATVSNRVFDPDTLLMSEPQVDKLKALLDSTSTAVQGSSFRLGVSRLDGPDKLDGGETERSLSEIREFRNLVGDDPVGLPREQLGKRLSNKIGDYDALFDHYCRYGDAFVTLDQKDYLHLNKRLGYAERLGLYVMSPAEFVSLFDLSVE